MEAMRDQPLRHAVGANHVADAANGVNQLLRVIRVDLLAQMIDHDVDDVRARDRNGSPTRIR